ncbi:MAG: NAD(P)-dependent oxidoreductase [Acidimicrobiales bacterium]|nr:NAD(P)-dependent oxidoreductase [Acidimicrobiales bacterium]
MSGPDRLRVGFVGLGSQGAPMARRIAEDGFPTVLWARRPESVAPFADTGATVVATPAELGASCEVLGICVVDDAGVEEVLLGADGALVAMAPGSIVLVHSTVRPGTCRRLQTARPDVSIVDAPVSGGGQKAAERELLVMVGGPEAAVERCQPVLATFGNPVLHLGPLGAGQEAKLLNNAVFTAQLAIAAEAFALAGERGLDRVALATILSSGSGRSYAAEIVAGVEFDLAAFGPLAGDLLAKDVAILDEEVGLASTSLGVAARTALERMGVVPADG